jgi:hypothetical protein
MTPANGNIAVKLSWGEILGQSFNLTYIKQINACSVLYCACEPLRIMSCLLVLFVYPCLFPFS